MRTNQYIAIEDLLEAGLLKDIVLTVIKHLHLATMVLIAGTLIRAQLKYAFLVLPVGRRQLQLGPARGYLLGDVNQRGLGRSNQREGNGE